MSAKKIRGFASRIVFQSKVDQILARHLYILLLIPLFCYCYFLVAPGIIIAGDFPYLDTPDYAKNRLWLWIDKGSFDGFEFVPRFPIIGLWYLLSIIHIGSELATKVMVMLGFSLASFSFYFSFLQLFKSRFSYSSTALKISALLGSLFYAYNVWTFNRIHHWYLWIGYSIFPLFFVSVYFSFKNPKDWKWILSSIFLWSFASTTPHMTLFYGVVVVLTFLGFIFNGLFKKKKLAIQLGTTLLLTFFFYSMVNMYWIYPYILASQIQAPAPNYEFTKENVELLSRDGDFINSFRVMAYWLTSEVEKQTEHSLLYYLSFVASFIIPVISFSALFLKNSIKYALIFSIVALIGIPLAMGTKSPFDYYTLALSTPTLSKFAWVFRDPDKLSFIIAFSYSFLLGIVSYRVVSVTRKDEFNRKKKFIIVCFFLLLLAWSIFLSSYPFYQARTDSLKPILFPKEFDSLNAYLSTVNTDKVYFIPYPQDETQWQPKSRVYEIYQTHSIKPSIESTAYNIFSNHYYNYLANSITENRTKNVGNLIYPLGTSYLIFHNDTWNKNVNSYDQANMELLRKLYFLDDLKNVANTGFYKIFKINKEGNDHAVGQINIPSQNFAVLGGLDIMASLNAIPSFNSLQSSISFLDDIYTKDTNTLKKSYDALILDRSSSPDDFIPSFVGDKYIRAPFDVTNNYDPHSLWSKSSPRDPENAEFHPYLKNLGIENWDLDYGKGLVITSAMGSKLSVPVEIENKKYGDGKNNNFDLYMRYLKNEKGGQIKIYLDDELINEVDTLDKTSNKFVWEKIGSIKMTKDTEKHTLTLENVAGFNAVNIFAFIPPNEMNRLMAETDHLLGGKTPVIYLLEAESNFYNDRGANTGLFHNLIDYNNNASADNRSSFTKTFSGQFKVPQNSDLVTLQFLAKKNPSSKSSFSIKDLDITPSYEKYNVFTSDFERKNATVPLATLRHLDWMNFDKDLLSTSLESNRPVSGNNSLRVDLKQGDKVGWNILSTDYIPIDDEAYYNASLEVSAKDVKQLHSRILYFDSDMKGLTKATDFVFKGKDGTFQDKFTSSILPPKGAKYLKYQVLTMSTNEKPSSYILDNVKLDEIIPSQHILKHEITSFKNLSYDRQDMILNNNTIVDAKSDQDKSEGLLTGKLGNANTTGSHKAETESFPVEENRLYNYTMTVEGENLNSLHGIASFKSSDDVVENSTRYGNNASNGRVLSLSSGSEINTGLDIIKPSNYTIAIRAKTCETCTFLNVSIEGPDNGAGNNYKKNIQSNLINLKDKDSGLNWIYSNSTYHLNKGKYKLKIYSNSETDLDSVLIYQNNYNKFSSNLTQKSNETLKDIFNIHSSPAHFSGFKKINPTKYVVDINNATRPYIVSLAEAYDPFWNAHVGNKGEINNNNMKINSFPLYGVVNGFYVNKTGNYTLVIEYQPQDWFIQGLTISIFTLVMIGAITLFLYKKIGLGNSYTLVTRIKKYIGYKKHI
jgi:hypothetical protein